MLQCVIGFTQYVDWVAGPTREQQMADTWKYKAADVG